MGDRRFRTGSLGSALGATSDALKAALDRLADEEEARQDQKDRDQAPPLFSQEIDLFPTSQEGLTRVMAPLDRGIYNPAPDNTNIWGVGPGGTALFPTEFVPALDNLGNIDWDVIANMGADGGVGGTTQLPPIAPPQQTSGYQPPEIKWKVGDYQAQGPNVPDWWQPMIPQSGDDYNRPDAAYSMMMNALIPSLSPEDQVTIARQLYEIWGNDFSMYKDIQPEHQISAEQAIMGLQGPVADEEYFLSAQRAQDATATLSAMREATVGGNRWKLGPGYKFLQEILNTFRGSGFTTRSGTVGAFGELDPLLGQTRSGELAPFGPMAQMIANPFFSQFQLNPVSKTQGGDFIFGQPNQWLQF